MSTPHNFMKFTKELKIVSSCKGATVLGYSRLRYAPPHDGFEARKVGHLNLVVIIQVDSFAPDIKTVSAIDILEKKIEFSPVDWELLDKAVNHQYVFPQNVIDLEGSPLPTFSPISPQQKKTDTKNCLVM